MNRLLPLMALGSLLFSCAASQPQNISNVCQMFEDRRAWYKAAERTEQRWGVPVSVSMAFIHQESAYQARIRPARSTVLWVIPWTRPSSAYGYAQALDATGYAPGDQWPLLTGQDADLANVQAMLQGKQTMTVWKDTRMLGDQVSKMIDQMVKGEDVDVNDEETYDNGEKVVPSFLIEPVVVTQDNVEEQLVESEFYTAEDLGL